jgi:hypothetical protein
MVSRCSLHALPYAHSTHELVGPYALHNSLPAGTFSLQLKSTASACTQDASHDWHHYHEIDDIANLMLVEDESLLRSLDFLIRHRFVTATCSIRYWSCYSALHIRIYLIPFDLANVEGRLRRRDENTILKHARKFLRDLLLKLSRNITAWNADSVSSQSEHSQLFFGDQTVCCLQSLLLFLSVLTSASPHRIIAVLERSITCCRLRVFTSTIALISTHLLVIYLTEALSQD